MPLAGALITRPLKITSPLLGDSRPEISLSSVDFPQPDGPTTERKLPLSIRQDRLSKTVKALPLTKKTLLRPLTSMIGCPVAAPEITDNRGPGALVMVRIGVMGDGDERALDCDESRFGDKR